MRRKARYTKVSPKRPVWQNPTRQTATYRLKYIDNGFSATPSSALYQVDQVFRGNSVYDPDYTGVGVQPYGYDEICALGYAAYCVRASKITVNFMCNATTKKLRVFLVPTLSTSLAYTDPSDLSAYRNVRQISVDSQNLNRRNRISHYCTSKWMFAANPPNQGISLVNNNPGTAWYWHVIFDTSDTAEEVEILYDVKIVYYTIFAIGDDINES